MRHAFFADMGGFLVKCSDARKPVPLNAERLLLLIKRKHIPYPICEKAFIDDKNKYDGLSR